MTRFALLTLALSVAGCDPAFEYCATVSRCEDGSPVEDLRVRFDHEGVYDTRTDAQGRTCSGGVGSPRAHDVRIELDKDGYVPVHVVARSRDLDVGGGRGLDVAVCVCEVDVAECTGGLIMAMADAGANQKDAGADP